MYYNNYILGNKNEEYIITVTIKYTARAVHCLQFF